MEQFEFKCPQCGQLVSAYDSLRDSVVACPHCEKGIVVPQKTRKPILAPVAHGLLAKQEVDYAMRAIERRIGKPISEQSIIEDEEKDDTRQSSIVDMLKLIGLAVVIGLVVFDVFSVRSQNKAFRKTIETQKAEMEHKLKAAAAKGINYEQELREAEQSTSDAKTRAKERESELTGRIAKMEESHRKELEEQRKQTDRIRTSFENKMREREEDFAREREHLQAELRSARELYALVQKNSVLDSAKEKKNDGSEDVQSQPKLTVAKLRSKIKANQEECKSLRMSNPGCILVDYTKQARILETRFRTSALGKYCAKNQVTYVRSLFRCTACNWEGSELDGPCCNVSRKRSYSLWRKAVGDAQKTAQINARIDELLKENEDLKKAMCR